MNPKKLKKALREIVGREWVLDSPEDLFTYSYDAKVTGDLPQIVVLPGSEQEVSAILKLAQEEEIPVFPRGAATGAIGGSVPVGGGMVLSVQRMNAILEINEQDQYARVQPGVITEHLQKAALDRDLLYPPDPASAANCTIGGNIATGAGGLRAVKYRVTADYVLALRTALAGGKVISTGTRTRKGVVGYDLTRLMVGSEGTLGVVTEAVLRLVPRPQATTSLVAHFQSIEQAGEAAVAVLASEVIPAALEIMDSGAIDAVRQYGEGRIPVGTEAFILADVDGKTDEVRDQARKLAVIFRESGAFEVNVAADTQEAEALWKARRSVSPALYRIKPRKVAEDVAVPTSKLPELIRGVRAIADKHDLVNVNYGHAGDGNLHVNLLIGDESELARSEEAVREIFSLTLSLGGTISGEHGIGLAKREFISMELEEEVLRLSREIKRAFDPKGIMNPGKVFISPREG